MRKKNISDHMGKPSGAGMGDSYVDEKIDVNFKSNAKEEEWDKSGKSAKFPLLNSDNILLKENEVELTASSNLDSNHLCENVLKDDESEWASKGDHIKATISLSFLRKKINKIIIADRAGDDASMINGVIEIHGGLQGGDKVEKLKSIDFDGLPGDGGKIEVNVGGIFASKIVVKAGHKVWGKNIGLRYLGVE